MDLYFNKIASILKDNIGLDFNTIGKTSIEKILIQRMMSCKIDSIDDYYQHLINNRTELNELLEFAVIPETWFFRDIRPFNIIKKHIQTALLKNRNKCFNILSIPCSTGEEPYSVAMHLIDNGLPGTSFNIDAVDISQRALQFAQQAQYGKNSFRGNNYQEYKGKYFTNKGNYYQLDEKISDKVSFNKLNILQDDSALKNKYDFILCRNLLIYFDVKTKEVAFKNLSSLMKNTGLLFIGHSEFGAVPKEIFKNLGSSISFALTKKENPDYTEETDQNSAPNSLRKNNVNEKTKPVKKVSFSSLIQERPQEPSIIDDKAKCLLDDANSLANSGQYDKAEQLCQKYIDVYGENETAYYLLGTIASGKQQVDIAESMLRKAIFLNPKHYEALIHLSLLLQQKGDVENAELVKKRADKALNTKQ